jgi:hypothetical protein
MRNIYNLVVILPCFFLLSCGSLIPRITARGELAGQKIDTTVDSQIAKYYLEHYLSNNRSNSGFDNKIDSLFQGQNTTIPSREYLKTLSQETSVDFAALYLAKRILEIEANRGVHLEFKKELAKLKNIIATGDRHLPADSDSYIFLFVPGWVYKSEAGNGADFAKPRKILTQQGLENYLVEIKETGTMEENAAYVAKEIIRYGHFDKNLILVSASSGGPAVIQAIGELLSPAQLKNVRAWVNIGGVLRGSFLADSAVRWPKRWLVKLFLLFKGWDYDSIESMTVKQSQERITRVNIAEHIFCLNYAGIPLSGHITKRAKDGYMDLRKHGPNDGLTLITDELIPHRTTIAEIGLDHFYLDPEIDLKTVALARLVVNHLEDSK